MIKGEQLRHLRNMHDLKQIEIARKLGITQQAYSHLEKKKWITGKRFLQILDVFGYTEEELENWIKNLPPPPKMSQQLGVKTTTSPAK